MAIYMARAAVMKPCLTAITSIILLMGICIINTMVTVITTVR